MTSKSFDSISKTTINEWQLLFPWLYFENKFAYCKFCKIHFPDSTFALGQSVFKKHNFQSHNDSSDHIKAVGFCQEEVKQTKLNIPNNNIPNSKPNCIDVPLNLIPIFKGIIFMAKHHIALSNSKDLFKLIEDSGSIISERYRDHVAATEILECISQYTEDKTIENLRNVRAFGLQIDETTDNTQMKQLALFVTYPFGCSTIPYLLSVMCGQINGVVGLLKKDIPELLGIHCMAHRINLVSGDILDEFPDLKLIDSILYNIHKLFKKSTKKLQILNDYERQQIKKFKKVIKPTQIRWFSLYNAILRIIDIWKPLIEALKEICDFDVSAKGVLESLMSFKVIFLLHFLADLLSLLNNLNLTFQQNTVVI